MSGDLRLWDAIGPVVAAAAALYRAHRADGRAIGLSCLAAERLFYPNSGDAQPGLALWSRPVPAMAGLVYVGLPKIRAM